MMHKILALLIIALVPIILINSEYALQEQALAAPAVPAQAAAAVHVPVAPDKPAQKAAAAPAPAPAPAKKAKQAPVRLSIPAIELNNPVVPMGIDKNGDLDVPAGDTKDIGWYAKGVVPGTIGSAVMDAHVFAAFSRLHEVKEGDDIYVVMADGSRLRFVVERAKVYKLEDLSPDELYNRKDGRYLHLITCAGELTDDNSTYTHRLVVYAKLAD